MTPIVCPRTWAENGDVAVTAIAVRMIYYSRHTHEEEAKNTPRSIVTPIVCPRTWAENGDAAVTATATAVRMIYYSSHAHEKAKKHTAVDYDTDRVPANMGRKR